MAKIKDFVNRSKAFAHCYDLTEVVIQSSMTFIGEKAFSSCESLTKIYCEATEQPAGWASDRL